MYDAARIRTFRGSFFRRMIATLPVLTLAACGDERGPVDAGRVEVAAVQVTAPAASV